MAILIFSLKIHVTLVKKIFGVIIKIKKDSEKNVGFFDNFQLNFSDQYKKTITKKRRIKISLPWYELGMFEHILYNSYISLY
jgi:Txe/YoeB family toxin of Txe-Axe toxin-antitoxin module